MKIDDDSKPELSPHNHSPRRITLDGALNTRDIGGYETETGRRIRLGKLYRSSELSYLSDADVDVIRSLGISRVVDFRGLREAGSAPDRLPAGVVVVPSPIIRDDLDMDKVHQYLDRHGFPAPMHDVDRVSAYGPYYRMLTLVNSYDEPGYVEVVAGYRPFFQTLLDAGPSETILAHCTGGRDRTGVAIFFLMKLLGVPQEQALSDYLLSNVYLQPDRDDPGSIRFRQFRFSNIYTQPPENKAFQEMAASLGTTSQAIFDSIRLQPEYPLSLLANIEKRHGSFEAFMENVMGVGPHEADQLRNLLLESAS